MEVIFGLLIGGINGILWPILIVFLPLKFVIHSKIRSEWLIFLYWSIWLVIALFSCVEATLYITRNAFPNVINFKEEIGKYIAMGIFIGVFFSTLIWNFIVKTLKR